MTRQIIMKGRSLGMTTLALQRLQKEGAMPPEETNNNVVHNPHAPGNVPGSEGYDPTKEADVPQSDTSTLQHTDIGGPGVGGVVEPPAPAPVVTEESTPDFPVIVALENVEAVTDTPDLFVTVSDAFAEQYGVQPGEIEAGKLLASLRENGWLLPDEAAAEPTTEAADA